MARWLGARRSAVATGSAAVFAIAALAAGPAAADETAFGVQGETMLIEDKTVAGLSVYGFYSMFGLQLGFALAWLDEEDPRPPIEGSFIGGLFHIHALVRFAVMQPLTLRAGTGLDAWLLWGIDEDEQKYAMPLVLEARFHIGDHLNLFVQPRYYLIASDGLEIGVAPDGDEGSPFLVTVGVGGEW